MIRELEQGWDYLSDDLFVCASCFDDYAIKQFIESSASEKNCSYCKRCAKEPIAASMNSVLDVIGGGITSVYEDPVHSLPVEGGEYVFDTMDIDEVFGEVGWPTESDAVADEIRNAFSGRAWVEMNFFRLREDDLLRYGWEDFAKSVKHRTRYLFSVKRSRKSSLLDDKIPPHEMLGNIGRVIQDVELVREMKKGTRWFRARIHAPAEKYTTASELGTVPQSKAIFSNRMSPAGIPMFYGAEDQPTAIAETYSPKPGKTVAATVGVFESARDMDVLDLTNLPAVPSLFNEDRRHLRPAISFLHDFVADLTKPIKKDGREHIEYVPTQIVTEYFRHVIKTITRKRVRGILYRSSQNGAGTCCVFFFLNGNCCDVKEGWDSDLKHWLGLISVTRKKLRSVSKRSIGFKGRP